MQQRFKIFKSHWFLCALCVLLLNDFVLKNIFHNWLTGKLSDFAGLFVFAIFWSAILPAVRKTVYIFTAIAFACWKSELAELVIVMWNSLPLFKIDRVIDYTDNIALFILPVGYFFQWKRTEHSYLRISPAIPIVLSSFAFLATSEMEPTFFDDYAQVYYIKADSINAIINDLRRTDTTLFIYEMESGHTKYQDGTIKLNIDSIYSVSFTITPLDLKDSTFVLKLTAWESKRRLTMEDTALANHQRQSIRDYFENHLLRNMDFKKIRRNEN